ncbi:hypothetical protein N7539_003574 [Penicillium diatomitis]|uniref:Uncharacterized protein n=1 Tax=Penicillium diatomitis TaxID=2819901 RepID=A0A9X0BXN7_9EURO|nr:uncharacterized protein N7539_003574 [Penicillium diatomitis]KAJ5488684.1 hypothetical protein N7539_003574 [Penicillium diatomitis]
MSETPPNSSKNRRRRHQRIQESFPPPNSDTLHPFGQPQFFENVRDVDMTDVVEENTDVEMIDAPPVSYEGAPTWVNDSFEQTKIIAEGLASINAALAQLEWYVRTGIVPVEPTSKII